MRLEDKNFKQDFMEWLNSKTTKQLINSLKKYAKPKRKNDTKNYYSVKHEIQYDYSKVKCNKEFLDILRKLPPDTVI